MSFIRLVLLFVLLAATRAGYADTVYEFPLTEIGAGGIATGWCDDSSWADIDVRWGADQVFEELKVQRVTQEAIRNGRAQLAGPEFRVRAGYVYTVSARMRSLSGRPAVVDFGIREQSAPYRDYAVRRNLEAGDAWRNETFFFKAQKDGMDHRLYLGFPNPCDVSIERIWIREETLADFEKRRASQENVGAHLHANPYFDLGTSGWHTYAAIDRVVQYPQKAGWQNSVNPPAFSVRTGEDGTSVGVMELGEWTSVLLSDMVDVVPGQPLKVKIRLRRSEGEGRPVVAKVFSPHWPWQQAPSRHVNVGQEWQDIELSGTVPLEDGVQARVELHVPAGGTGELEVAHVIISHNPAEAVREAGVGFGIAPGQPMSVYEVGDPVRLSLHHSGGQGQAVQWTLVDTHGTALRSGFWNLGSAAEHWQAEGLPVGWYRLNWSAPWAAVQKEGGINLGIVPPIARSAGSASPFGVHVEGSEQGLHKMELLGAQWLRTNNPHWTKWAAVQPEKDVWVYPDAFVNLFIDAGKDIVFLLDRTPQWASRRSGDVRHGTDFFGFRAALPVDMNDWKEYVRQMVTRYGDRISHWEVWNEPDIIFLTPPEGMTNAEAYYELISTAAPVVHEIDPQAKVMMSPAYYLKKHSNPEGYQEDFTQKFIEMGGMKFVDIYAIHYYLTAGQRLFDNPEGYAPQLNYVRDAMRAAGKTPVIWDSEWGIINFTDTTNGVRLPSGNGMSPDRAAQELVIWSAAQLAAGIEKLFWYDGLDNFYHDYHVTRNFFDYRQPKPAFVAYSVLTKVLDGFVFEAEEFVPDSAGRVLRFRNGDKTVRVAYAHAGKSFNWPVADGVNLLDHLGGSIAASGGTVRVSEAPVYIGGDL